MSALRSQLSFLLRGHRQLTAALDGLGTDLQALQHKVADLENRMWAWERLPADSRQDELDAIDALRRAVSAAVDDLTARYVALSERVEPR
jgi:outer membrane murein-binding lipoprotein Lpp